MDSTPVIKTAKRPLQGQGALDLRRFLDCLVREGHLAAEAVESLVQNRMEKAGYQVPVLAYLADQKLPDLRNAGRMLDIETLTQKLAEASDQPY